MRIVLLRPTTHKPRCSELNWTRISQTYAVRWSHEYGLNLRRRHRYVDGIILAVLLIGVLETGLTYFRQYVNEPQLYIQTDGDLADIARWLNTHDTGGEPVYLAALHYRHPTVAALSEKFDEVKWIAGNRGIVLPKGPGYLFFARLGLPDETWLHKVLPDSALIDKPLAPDGETNYRLYHLDAQPVITPSPGMRCFSTTPSMKGAYWPKRQGPSVSGMK